MALFVRGGGSEPGARVALFVRATGLLRAWFPICLVIVKRYCYGKKNSPPIGEQNTLTTLDDDPRD